MTFPVYELMPCHRDALNRISAGMISPQEFLSIYPDINYRDLAGICHCSEATVAHWFSAGSSRREPKPAHLLWLSLAHHALQRVERERRRQFAA